MTEPVDAKTDTPPTGLVVAGPWTRRPPGDSDQQPHVLEPVPADVYDAAPVSVSGWQQRLTESAGQPVLPLLFRDPERALASTRYVTRELARMAARRALDPKTWFHPLPPTSRGLWRWTKAGWRWLSARDVRDDHLRRPGAKVATLEQVSERQRTRLIILASGTAATGIGELVGYLLVGVEVQVGTGLVVAAAAYLSGRKKSADRPTILSATSAGGLKPGIPLGLLERGVLASLADSKVPAEVTKAPASSRWGWTITVTSEAEIDDKAIKTMERRLRARRGAITAIADPENAAQMQLRIVHTDLLAQVGAPPERKPLSLTITEPGDFGRTMDGDHLILELLRVHALLVGGTGSGKSSALWTKLDFYTACRDVIVYGIDLTGGPVFRAWGGCIRKVATTPEDARDLLERFIRLSKARAARLGERSEPRPDGPPPGDENWDPSKDGPAYVLVIDEYPTLVDAKIDGKPARLADLVTTLLRIGRKTATQVDLAAQRAGRSDLGNTTVKAMCEVQVLLPCSAGDVDMLWPGKRAEGWRPDLLKGASGRRANDAGKLYVNASGHDEPRIDRFYRLTIGEIHRRAIARMKAGLPEPDEYSARAWDSDLDITDVVVHELPKLIADLLDALDANQTDGLPSAQMVAHLAETDPDGYPTLVQAETPHKAQMALAALAAVHGLSTIQLGGVGNPRGYRRAEIISAIDGPGGPL